MTRSDWQQLERLARAALREIPDEDHEVAKAVALTGAIATAVADGIARAEEGGQRV